MMPTDPRVKKFLGKEFFTNENNGSGIFRVNQNLAPCTKIRGIWESDKGTWGGMSLGPLPARIWVPYRVGSGLPGFFQFLRYFSVVVLHCAKVDQSLVECLFWLIENSSHSNSRVFRNICM